MQYALFVIARYESFYLKVIQHIYVVTFYSKWNILSIPIWGDNVSVIAQCVDDSNSACFGEKSELVIGQLNECGLSTKEEINVSAPAGTANHEWFVDTGSGSMATGDASSNISINCSIGCAQSLAVS